MPKRGSRPRLSPDREKEELRARGLVMLAAFQHEEPSDTWAKCRDVLQQSTRLSDLRTLARELRAATGAMSPRGRQSLLRELSERFGPDPEYEADLAVVKRVRRRGRVNSEREYRSVQAYADS